MLERNLNSEVSHFLPALANLKMICGDDDQELIGDMIEGELDVHRIVGRLLELILADEADIEGLKFYLKRVADRRRRLEDRVGRLRTLLASVVTALPQRKYRHPLALVSAFDVDARIIIQDESAIPSDFWIPQDPKLHESGLRRHLLERQRRLDELALCRTDEERNAQRQEIDNLLPIVPGVALGNGEVSVRIRVA